MIIVIRIISTTLFIFKKGYRLEGRISDHAAVAQRKESMCFL